MAKGDVAVSLTLPVETDRQINKLAQAQGRKEGRTITRREIIIQAVKLLSETK